jgi:ATP-dependent DNA ligase
MELIQTTKPFDDADRLFDVKYDGFRSLAYIENGTCRLVSPTTNASPTAGCAAR